MADEPRTDIYRQLAERMLRTAKTVTDQKAKAELVDIAAAFVMLGDFKTLLEDCASPADPAKPERALAPR